MPKDKTSEKQTVPASQPKAEDKHSTPSSPSSDSFLSSVSSSENDSTPRSPAKKEHPATETTTTTTTTTTETTEETKSTSKTPKKTKGTSSKKTKPTTTLALSKVAQEPSPEESASPASDKGPVGEKVLFRVYLADNTYKTLYIDPATATTTDVWRMLCERLQLPESEWQYFFLWTVSSDVELLMYTDTVIEDAVKEYPALRASFTRPAGYRAPGESVLTSFFTPRQREKEQFSASKYVIESDAVTFQDLPRPQSLTRTTTALQLSAAMSPRAQTQLNLTSPRNGAAAGSVAAAPNKKSFTRTRSFLSPLSGAADAEGGGSGSGSGSGSKFLFRTTQILPHVEELRVVSPTGTRLLYLEGVHDVLCGNHPFRPASLVKLAALQLCASKGPYDDGTWQDGTISDHLALYIPKHAASLRSARAWEDAICDEYAALGDKMSALDCQRAYLDIVQQLPSYGSTFFPVTFIPEEVTPFKQVFEGDILLGVNAIGVHLIDTRLCRRADTSPVRTCPFQRIISWESDKLTFFFEYLPAEGNAQHPILLTFSTPHGNMINDLLYDWLEAFRSAAAARLAVTQVVTKPEAASKGAHPKGKSKDKKKKKKSTSSSTTKHKSSKSTSTTQQK